MKSKPVPLLVPPLWCFVCRALCIAGAIAYGVQEAYGLSVTGLSRSFSWGLYISQFVFMVGVAAGAVMVSLPIFWHNLSHFRAILPLAELLAAVSVLISMLFLFVDLGQTHRVLYVLLHPSPSSLMFWDMLLLVSYGVVNIILAVTGLRYEKNGIQPPRWAFILGGIGVVMAFAIHTVTGFIFAGLPGRVFWLSALTAPMFLASAFCTGPSVLLLLLLAARSRNAFYVKSSVVHGLCTIITYAMCVYLFFQACEVFSDFYSGNIQRIAVFTMLYFGGENGLGWLNIAMWLSVITALLSCFMLFFASTRRDHTFLAGTLAMLLLSVWINKGIGFMAAGFGVDAFGRVQSYVPQIAEYIILLGVYALGALLITIAWRFAFRIKRAEY